MIWSDCASLTARVDEILREAAAATEEAEQRAVSRTLADFVELSRDIEGVSRRWSAILLVQLALLFSLVLNQLVWTMDPTSTFGLAVSRTPNCFGRKMLCRHVKCV